MDGNKILEIDSLETALPVRGFGREKMAEKFIDKKNLWFFNWFLNKYV